MKVVSNILKVLAILAAIAGVVFVVATYGDKIVAWAKRLLDKLRGEDCFCYFDEECCCDEDCCCEDAVQAEEADFEG